MCPAVGLLLEWRTDQWATAGVADRPVHLPWTGEPTSAYIHMYTIYVYTYICIYVYIYMYV